MKNINLIKVSLLIIIGSITFTSCKKFLVEDPKSYVSVSNYYKTESDAVSAVNSIYSYLNSINTGSTAGVYHSSFWVTAGLASDEMNNRNVFSPDLDQISKFTASSQNNTLQEIWTMHYKTITIANIAIERIQLISMNDVLKARLIGEAKFLRGLMYFNMVRMFGEIPLIITEKAPLTPTTSSIDKIYTQIII